ncbi:MAG TPA: homocysteine S-methyltransferase family protein [Clostridia bacterium]|nr:homocysteine S-methyltransferase family protein [Clostridia bacterium]
MSDIKDLFGKRLIFFDGAMGSMLQKNGLVAGELPEVWNITQSETVTDIHSQYIEAGCDFITTNTFGANSIKLDGCGYSTQEIIAAALSNAKKSVEKSNKNCRIAFDIGPIGKLLEPAGNLSFDEAYNAFSQAAVIAEKCGADLAIIETMTDTYEMKAAILAVKENTNLPVFATFSFDIDGKLLTGGDVACAITLLEGLGVDALGVNCSVGPELMKGYLKDFNKYSSTPIIVTPNAGMPKLVNSETVYDIDADEFADQMLEIAKSGAHILGGCCGTTPEHIEKTIKLCADIKPKMIEEKDFAVVSSYAKICVLGEKPVIIGERINPTGKKLFKEALRNADFDYLVSQGLSQVKDGAHILDVNVGLPEIDEKSVMLKAIRELQSSITLPLQIDTADASVMESALRYYNGKALINSVNGKIEDMKKIFPLVKKYGGTVIALTLDENGIPETPEGRLKIAQRIVKTAGDYGIDKKDIIVDALTMTVSASPDAAKVTLESVALIKKTLGVKTVLGVSNVSFGLPSREVINSVFFAQALSCGLDVAIINPGSVQMMNAYYSHNALAGLDEQCTDYINNLSSLNKPNEKMTKKADLYTSIIQGFSDSAYKQTKQELSSKNANDIIEGVLVPALDEVGKAFENKTLFLPQLIKSAYAAQKAFLAIKENIAKSNECKQESKGNIVIATVKGDVHDIGKNIVKVMLENYGYNVIDLGKNVDCELIVNTVCAQNARLLGLSALMTTTVPSMKRTIQLIKDRGIDCKVMVGGAVLTPEYSKTIGADFYAKDAMQGISIAKEVFSEENL